MTTSRIQARIIGLGSYLPENILTNQDLEKLVDTTDEWIISRTGMKERRVARTTEFASCMGAAAAKKALQDAKIGVEQVDLILVATMSPDYPSPSTAALIQASLGASKAAAVDIQAACTGYLYALSMAKAYIESGLYENILVIAAEKMSSVVDYQDRNTCVLFGDGAAAAVVSNHGPGFAIRTICLGADGAVADLLMIPGGGSRQPTSLDTLTQRLHYMKMNGKELFKHAVRRMNGALAECLDKSGLQAHEIGWVVPHQANSRIIEALTKTLNMPTEKVYKTLHKYGNTSASSVAIALDELTKEQAISAGEHIMLVAFGAGLTWGASLLTKV